jgi:hypothetical protein
MIKATVYMAGFFLVYRLFLSRDTLYGRNRTFILLSVVSAMILPLITIPTTRPMNLPVFGKVLSEIFISGSDNANSSAVSDADSLMGYRGLFIIYLSGVVFFGLKLIIDILELVFLIIRQRKRGSHIIKFHGLNTAGFSAFGHVFLNNRLTPDEADEII